MAHRDEAHQSLLVVEQVSGTAIVLSAAGTIDTVTAPQFQEHTATVLKRRPPALIIDLGRVEFLGSAGIAVLMTVQNTADDVAYAVVAAGPVTARPLHLLGIDSVIRIYPTVAEAIHGLGVSASETG